MLETKLKESDLIAHIERLELSVRETLRRIDHARTPADRRALNQQLQDMMKQIEFCRGQLPR